MNQDYIIPDAWSIIEEGFDPEKVESSESLFSLGNGAMGQRANFEEDYSGHTFQGSYIAGVYYPDKTRVGWWKNGYPEYFAKVLNAPNWIGIQVFINGVPLDLNTCKKISHFRRELNMGEGWYNRTFKDLSKTQIALTGNVTRFRSLDLEHVGDIKYAATCQHSTAEKEFIAYRDSGIKNRDSHWDDKCWNPTKIASQGSQAFIEAYTVK